MSHLGFLRKGLEGFKIRFAKLNNAQVFFLFIIIFILGFSLFYLLNVSSRKGKVLLYNSVLSQSDFDRVKDKLTALKIHYHVYKGKYFLVENEQQAVSLRAKIGLENILKDVKGFELFDQSGFSTTDFERKVNYQRAITGSIVRHLESLDDIDKAEVVLSFGEDNVPFYQDEIGSNTLTASVSLKIAPFSDLRENKKKLRGLINFIAHGIDRLDSKNVIIIDQQTGVNLTDIINSGEGSQKIILAKNQLNIKYKIINNKIKEFKKLLSGIYTKDRYEILVDVDIDWNSRSVSKKQIDPILLKKDNPDTPYDESEVLSSISRSNQNIKEKFKGPAFIPEGPPGSEPNVSPGAKELIDRQTDYEKETRINNNEFSESNIVEKNPPYQIKDIKVSVAIDGVWVKEKDSSGNYKLDNGQIIRKYTAVSVDRIVDIKKLLEGSLNKTRGDKVEVKHIQFDRIKQFEIEDSNYLLENSRKNFVSYVIIGIVSFMGICFLFYFIRRYVLARRRIKEIQAEKEREERRRQEIKMRQQGSEISKEDKERLELQESVINAVRERPEIAANLIKTWLVE